MKSGLFILIVAAVVGVLVPCAGRAEEPAPASFEREVAPFLKKHCYHCHGNDKRRGDIALDVFADHESVQRGRKTWQKAIEMVRSGDMPPEERPRPEPAEAAAALAALEAVLAQFDCDAPRPAGRV